MEAHLGGISLADEQPRWDDVPSHPPPSISNAAVNARMAPPSPPKSQASTQPDLSDLDPYAPAPRRLLGETVTSTSKLELLDSSSEGEPPTPVEEHTTAPPSVTAQPDAGPSGDDHKKRHPSTLSLASPGASTTFLGGMFRSLSGANNNSGKTAPSPALPANPTPPAQSLSSPSPAITTPIPNPLLGLAGLIRNSTSNPTSADSSRPGTPEKTHAPEQKQRQRDHQTEKGTGGLESGEGKVDDEVVFDFNRFLEQMRQRSADPVAKYLRSFLKEFSRRPPLAPSDQTRVINDFLDFISAKMRQIEPWKSLILHGNAESGSSEGDEGNGGEMKGEQEFDMALEAMEKLVMNRLWHLTFSPAIEATIAGGTSNTDDLERDHVLTQRIRLFSWVEPRHLDLPIPILSPANTLPSDSIVSSTISGEGVHHQDPPLPSLTVSPSSPNLSLSSSPSSSKKASSGTSSTASKAQKQTTSFLAFAQRELSKMNDYKAPRDKMICVLNCCKVIFGLIRHVGKGDEGADSFIPFLIYIVLKTNPKNLVSNIQYVQRFRNPEKLSGEGGYYLSSLNGAISFIETMDASSLSDITQEQFESNVEAAILALPIDPNDTSLRLANTPSPTSTTFPSHTLSDPSATSVPASEPESPLALSAPPPPTKNIFLRGSENVERIVSKPLLAIGRILDHLDPPQPPKAEPSRRSSGGSGARVYRDSDDVVKRIDDVHEGKRKAALETLKGVFPSLEDEVLEMVLLSTSGDVAQSVERLLEMS